MSYQVLYDDAVRGGGKGGIVDVRTLAEARRVKRKLVAAGKRNVDIWNTRDNALSRLLRI